MRQRVLEAQLPGWVDPARAFEGLFAAEQNAVWLDSGVHAERGMSYLGVGSRPVTASVASGSVTVDGRSSPGTILDFLRGELAEAAVEPGDGFRLGWVGWLGYELRAQTMGTTPGQFSRYPDASLLFVDRAIVFDHGRHSVSLMALGTHWDGDLAVWRDDVSRRIDAAGNAHGCDARRAELDRDCERRGETRGGAGLETRRNAGAADVTWAYSDLEYLALIRECQAAIVAGDAYQLCLTNEARVDARPDPLDTYLRLRASNPSHHGALFRAGALSLLSSSPELFLSVSPTGAIESKPIKGTRRRGARPNEDALLAIELESSAKERAENLMIVDLMRNDIGRVSEVGSVSVPSLLALESYAHVHQLVSTVRGQLARGLDGLDAVAACFPAGSMTGAPKHSAVAILDRLENRARGVYSGAFGYFGLDTRIDLSMVIRSIVLDADGATIGSGGGITALSVPEEELEEVRLKAAALLAVLRT